MVNQTKSPKTAAAIDDAMETACAAGNLEVAERLFESYRLLFGDSHERVANFYEAQPVFGIRLAD